MADSLVIFHNPSCSKSRQTLRILQEAGLTPADIQNGEQVVDVLLAHPALMERPIVV